MSVSAVCPGSFDPVTNGHLDVIERASACFDRVVVAVLVNPSKRGFFDVDDRLDLLAQTTGHLRNVETASFQGLLVDFCHDNGIDVICKGLRAVTDFEYELQMAQMNQQIGDVETTFLTTSPEWSYLSSSLVKEVASMGGDITGTVPTVVQDAILARFAAD